VKRDFLIIGSGLYGVTFAYRATNVGMKCLVVDKRPQLGINNYCETFGCGDLVVSCQF
jgi:UDP-galactopyranose mutase